MNKRYESKRICSVKDCGLPYMAKGLCQKHYSSLRLYGTTDLRRPNRCKPHEMHGMYGTPEYRIWAAMIQRTTDKNRLHYDDWGGRGIKVCPSWRNSFLSFYKDMGKRPTGMSINRINNDGNYEPGNCEWASMQTQARNTRVQKRSTSGVTGVTWNDTKQRWVAYIRVDGKLFHLGTFLHKEDAVNARKVAENKFFL